MPLHQVRGLACILRDYRLADLLVLPQGLVPSPRHLQGYFPALLLDFQDFRDKVAQYLVVDGIADHLVENHRAFVPGPAAVDVLFDHCQRLLHLFRAFPVAAPGGEPGDLGLDNGPNLRNLQQNIVDIRKDYPDLFHDFLGRDRSYDGPDSPPGLEDAEDLQGTKGFSYGGPAYAQAAREFPFRGQQVTCGQLAVDDDFPYLGHHFFVKLFSLGLDEKGHSSHPFQRY